MTAPTFKKDDWDDLDDTSLVPTGKGARELNKPAPKWGL